MTRRAFVAALVPLAGLPRLEPTHTKPPIQKFYLTGGNLTTDGKPRDDCHVPALISRGVDKAEALQNAGLKVWSAQEYFEGTDGVQAACAKARR